MIAYHDDGLRAIRGRRIDMKKGRERLQQSVCISLVRLGEEQAATQSMTRSPRQNTQRS